MRKTRPKLNDLARALRLPFVTVSILPFILGSFIDKNNVFYVYRFILGLMVVIANHLGANLINDYADSKSDLDWKDRKYYKFFGGSKLIQEGVFTEIFYLRLAIFFFSLATLSILILTAITRNILIFILYIIVLFLSFSYSHKPFQFSYHKLGEFVIFILFGPALVMGGHFIQQEVFSIKSFILSLPFGFLTTAILFANEIPDFLEDKKTGKLTWVLFLGPKRAHIIYSILIVCTFLSILFNIIQGYLGALSALALLYMFPALKAASILKKYPDKKMMVQSSELVILAHTFVSIVLILDIFI